MSPVACPRCSKEQSDLFKIEAGLKLRLQELQVESQVPDQVCVNCFKELSKEISQGAKLRAEVNAKEHNKKILWKNRVGLIKSARERMAAKAHAEAAVLYEKYIKTIEVTQEKPPGGLDPSEFKKPGLEKELTLIASAYWDLMRIYDGRPNYSKRMEETGNKLLQVLPLTDAGRDIVHRAERFTKQANNDKILKDFLKNARKATKSSCFIATAVFYFDDAQEVLILRQFRDQHLKKHLLGQVLIQLYYFLSPSFASLLDHLPSWKPFIRKVLRSIALRLAKTFNLKT